MALNSFCTPLAPQQATPIARGISYHWRYGDHVVVFTVERYSKGKLEKWSQAHRLILARWPDDRPYRAMIVARNPSLALKLLIEHRAGAVMQLYRVLVGRQALVLPGQELVPTMQMSLDTVARYEPNIASRIFLNESAALDWLTEQF